jgi:hypothetical protein
MMTAAGETGAGRTPTADGDGCALACLSLFTAKPVFGAGSDSDREFGAFSAAAFSPRLASTDRLSLLAVPYMACAGAEPDVRRASTMRVPHQRPIGKPRAFGIQDASVEPRSQDMQKSIWTAPDLGSESTHWLRLAPAATDIIEGHCFRVCRLLRCTIMIRRVLSNW